MNSFSRAWSVVKMPYKANACPQCGLPTLLPYFGDWSKSDTHYSTCMNCGFFALPNRRRSSNKYLTDKQKDYDKKRDEEIKQQYLDGFQEIGSSAGSMPRQKTDFSNPADIFQHPLEMVLADTGHESLSDLIRAYSRLKAEKNARLPDSIRSSMSDAEQHESELIEQAMSAFEERNAEHLLNTFLNMNRKVSE